MTYKGKTAEWWADAAATLQRERDQAQVRLGALRLLLAQREAIEKASLSRGLDGEPFPALLSAAEVRDILDMPLPDLDEGDTDDR